MDMYSYQTEVDKSRTSLFLKPFPPHGHGHKILMSAHEMLPWTKVERCVCACVSVCLIHKGRKKVKHQTLSLTQI